MRVLLDIHAIVGSQNGFDNSGQASQGVGPWLDLVFPSLEPVALASPLVRPTRTLSLGVFFFEASVVFMPARNGTTPFLAGTFGGGLFWQFRPSSRVG